jgi:hypothetical protein
LRESEKLGSALWLFSGIKALDGRSAPDGRK